METDDSPAHQALYVVLASWNISQHCLQGKRISLHFPQSSYQRHSTEARVYSFIQFIKNKAEVVLLQYQNYDFDTKRITAYQEWYCMTKLKLGKSACTLQ